MYYHSWMEKLIGSKETISRLPVPSTTCNCIAFCNNDTHTQHTTLCYSLAPSMRSCQYVLCFVTPEEITARSSNNNRCSKKSVCPWNRPIHASRSVSCRCETTRNVTRTIKPRRMRWARHVARTKRWKMCIIFWFKALCGRDHSEDLRKGRRIIPKWILKYRGWRLD